MTELQNAFPPGWESKFDSKTGKTYYINHHTKTSTWDDPRSRQRIHGTPSYTQYEHIPLQHGTPEFRRNYVYPSQNSPKPAFQMSAHYSPKYIPLQDMKPSVRSSPLLLQKTQESSLTNVSETDESVNKISAMFPTVSDTHIRLLLKKYHNREAVVISALQVEKHPIATPGPFATPPPARASIFPGGVHPSLQMTPPLGARSYSRGASPVTRFGSIPSSMYTDSPRIGDNCRSHRPPHSSPKLKLRYMKSIFPKAEETIILDVLTSNDNHIQKASDCLKRMGYERRDPIKLLQEQQRQAEEDKLQEERRQQAEDRIEAPLVPAVKSADEKTSIQARLQTRYKDVSGQVITIALDSVQYDEERANQILQIMVQEDTKQQDSSESLKVDTTDSKEEKSDTLQPSVIPVSQSRQSFKTLLISEKADVANKSNNFSRVVEENRSNNLSNTQGSNVKLAKGPNEKLLLADYITWQGPNTELRNGPQKSLAKGPNKANLSNKYYKAQGANSDLCKGPKIGLAKGSIFKQFRNIVIGESRGK